MEAIRDRNVVVTGIIPGHSRGTAQAALQDAGAHVQASMGPSTEVLVVGAKPGPKKITKAAELGIEVIQWGDLVTGAIPEFRNGDSAAPGVQLSQFRAVSPQLAQAGDLPAGDDWIFEIKWDGYRCVATIKGGQVAMQSRSGRSEYVEQFPRIAAALSVFPDCILDGELIVTDASGASNFETVHTGSEGIEQFVVFDMLELDGQDLRGQPLGMRRTMLESIVGETAPVRISQAVGDGRWLLDWVTEHSLEGVVAKRLSSRYVEGSRTEAWIKIKVRLEQEFVVLGWKPGEGSKSGVAGSLLLGVREGDGWKSCGRVGTGRDFDFWEQFTQLPEIDECVECDLGNATRADLAGIVWVEPSCVVQVAFQRWTKDHRLWHPSLQRVRLDKPALEVVRET